MNTTKIATTVKIGNELYDQFKIFGIRYKVTLQALVEKAVHRYVNEDKFRDEMNSFFIPTGHNGEYIASRPSNNSNIVKAFDQEELNKIALSASMEQ